ncbi:TetR/AcrR family transcriptional regulator [Propionibacteriaceae bacterium Y2011]
MTQQTLSRRRAETRERLIDAAIAVFARDGIDHARLEDISEEAGYTRGAFYSNFADKDDLITALLEREIERTTDIARQGISTALDEPGATDLATLVGRALGVVARNTPSPDWLVAERSLRLYALRSVGIARHLVRYESQRSAALTTLLEQAIEASGRRGTIPMEHVIAIIIAVGSEAVLMEMAIAELPADERAHLTDAPRPGSVELLVSLLSRITEPID